MIWLKIGLILVFCTYAALEGIREAYLYHGLNTSNPRPSLNLHPLFLIQRALFGALILWISWDILFCIGLMLIFSLFHNGMYLKTRNKLNPAVYPKGFGDESSTSNAFFEFSMLERVVLAELGAVVLILNLIFL